MALQFRGSNLTGGDCVYTKYPIATGPVSGTHYRMVSTQDVDYCISKGMNTFRLLFSWECMQPTGKAVIPAASGTWRTYFTQYKALVDYITGKGCTVILDIHGGTDATFAAYYGIKVGQLYNGVPVQDLFVDLWSKLATIFKANPRVMFGITNEPTDMPTMTWFTCAQAVINGIRATGATQKILMPGNYYSGASAWTYTGSNFDTGVPKRSNAYGWENANGVGKALVDPAMNTAVQVHMYFDANAGGGGTDIPSDDVGATRLKVVTDWARSRGLQVMLCEAAMVGSHPIAAATWKKTQDYMEANKDVILGWLWWAYGPPSWWGTYQFTLCPSGNYTVDSAQMNLIEPSLLAPAPTGPTQAAYDALKAERDALASEVSALRQERSGLLAERATLMTERDVISAEKDTLQAAYDLLGATSTALTAERDALRDALTATAAKIANLTAESDRVQARLTQIKSAIAFLVSEGSAP